MLTRTAILMATTALALAAGPVAAQHNTGGSSQMQGASQTSPQQNGSGMPAARGAATTGSDIGGSAPGASQGAGQPGRAEGRTANPSGVPGAQAAGGQATDNRQNIQRNPGNTTGNDARGDARGGVMAQGAGAPRDGMPGNPPSTATQRATDGVTGNRTDPDGTGNNPPGTAAGRAVDDATRGATGGAGSGATGGAMAVDSARLRDGRRASRVIGSTVYNEANESVGSVDDLIVPTGGGAPVAIVSVGGFLGIGARLVAVPYDRLQYNAERERWTLEGATRDSLQSLPAFEYDDRGRRG